MTGSGKESGFARIADISTTGYVRHSYGRAIVTDTTEASSSSQCCLICFFSWFLLLLPFLVVA